MSVDPPSFTLAEFGVMVTIFSALLGGAAWVVNALIARAIRPLESQVVERTKPIQANTNGDSINARVNQIITDLGGIRKDVSTMRSEVSDLSGRIADHVDWHLEHSEGRARSRNTD